MRLLAYQPSQQKCKSDNQTLAEERAALQKRRQQQEELKATKAKAVEPSATENQDTSVLDDLLDKLRSGDTIAGRRTRRQRPGPPTRTPGPIMLSSGGDGDAADIAKDMLARLKSDGFDAKPPPSPRPGVSKHRPRPRRNSASGEQVNETTDGDQLSNEPFSPTMSTTFEEESASSELEGQTPGD